MSLFMCSYLEATSLDDQCAARIKVLDKELSKAVQKRSYSYRKSNLIKEAQSQLSLDRAQYKKQINVLKQQYTESLAALGRGENGQYRKLIVACLLNSGELLQKIKTIARSGEKELDDFSKNWRSSFPGYVK